MEYSFWKEKDVQVLLECVKTNQTLAAAFKEAATKLGRTEAACNYKYHKVKQEKDTKKSNLWTPEEDKILSEQIEKNPQIIRHLIIFVLILYQLFDMFRETAKESKKADKS